MLADATVEVYCNRCPTYGRNPPNHATASLETHDYQRWHLNQATLGGLIDKDWHALHDSHVCPECYRELLREEAARVERRLQAKAIQPPGETA